MAGTVRLLDETLVDQIAAGEVVERPANVVKELLENAIDAGATSIDVALEDGGRALVSVRDDGLGMSREDAALCVERHATSKIASFQDLMSVRTLGFRGEALPSIGAVSRMSITTRRTADLEGTRVVVEGGTIRGPHPHGSPPGTTVVVEDLFYNVPARKKFLRARQTESSKIFEICQRTALIQPELRLEVASEGKTVRRYLPADSLTERTQQVFGDEPLRLLVARQGDVALEALLTPASRARVGTRHLFLYVNGRPVLDRRLALAVAFAYGHDLPKGHYPRGLVSLSLSPEDVDVNAHPQKTEVRFRHPSRLVEAVTRMLARSLDREAGRTPLDRPARLPPRSRPPAPAPPVPAPAAAAESVRDYLGPSPNAVRLIAQLRNRYLLLEADDRVYLLDRQRADARVRYEALTKAADEGALRSQPLLFPERLELDASARHLLDVHQTLLASLGFEWSALGERAYAVRAVPSVAARISAGRLFSDVIEVLRGDADDRRSEVLQAIARACAVPAGAALDQRAALDIVAGLSLADDTHRASVLGELALPEARQETSS